MILEHEPAWAVDTDPIDEEWTGSHVCMICRTPWPCPEAEKSAIARLREKHQRFGDEEDVAYCDVCTVDDGGYPCDVALLLDAFDRGQSHLDKPGTGAV